MNHWIRPSCDSRTGAAHLRRGAPCQDASGIHGFRDAAGSPIQVLVVSDGHGGARYVRSDVGARLACTVAMRELEQALAPARVADAGALEQWRHWLAAELPGRIVQAWRHEVEEHWGREPAADGSPFSPLLYGATLGVLLLTPRWWAHTGLGDWDLVRIEASAADASVAEAAVADASAAEESAGEVLLSEEPEREAGGEATFSLCLEGAERCFAARTVLQPLAGAEPPFALLLSSDGLRKSCGSDADFLTLSRYLAGLAPDGDQNGSPELSEALDHISRQGSGDDISVAVARWAPAQQGAAWPPPTDRQPAQLVQPGPAAASPPQQPTPGSAAAAAGAPADASRSASPPAAPSSEPRRSARVGSSADGRTQVRRSPRPRRRPSRPLWLAGALLAFGGAGLLIVTRPGFGPPASRRQPAPPVLTPQQRSDLQRQVRALCGVPVSSAAALQSSGAAAGPTAEEAATRPPAGEGPDSSALQAAAGKVPPPNPGKEARASGASAAGPVAQASDPGRRQRIAATLASRASVFRRLQGADAAQITAALQRSPADPLSALIALSASDPSLHPPVAPAQRSGWLQGWTQRGMRWLQGRLPAARPAADRPAPSAPPLVGLDACPELLQALQEAWQRQMAAGGEQGPAASERPGLPARDAAAGLGRAGSPPAATRAPSSSQPAAPWR